jgi:CheY-like chemotaxis protein
VPLFEVVLRRTDEPDEVRYTDRGYNLGDELELQHQMWVVTSVDEPPERSSAAKRVVCRPAAQLRSEIRVLVADDNDGVLRLFVDLVVAQPGMKLVATASDAESAITAAAAEQPDVAVLDVRMPGGGMHALEEIHRLSPETKVIVFTGDEGSAREMVEAGVVDVLMKGDPIAGLIAAIERAGRATAEAG